MQVPSFEIGSPLFSLLTGSLHHRTGPGKRSVFSKTMQDRSKYPFDNRSALEVMADRKRIAEHNSQITVNKVQRLFKKWQANPTDRLARRLKRLGVPVTALKLEHSVAA